jgi:hypothetical protein
MPPPPGAGGRTTTQPHEEGDRQRTDGAMPPPASLRPRSALHGEKSRRGLRSARLPQASGSAPCSAVLGRGTLDAPRTIQPRPAREPARARLRAPRGRRVNGARFSAR